MIKDEPVAVLRSSWNNVGLETEEIHLRISDKKAGQIQHQNNNFRASNKIKRAVLREGLKLSDTDLEANTRPACIYLFLAWSPVP